MSSVPVSMMAFLPILTSLPLTVITSSGMTQSGETVLMYLMWQSQRGSIAASRRADSRHGAGVLARIYKAKSEVSTRLEIF